MVRLGIRPRAPWRGPLLLRAQGLAETALIMAVVIGTRILLDLWFETGDAPTGFDDPQRQALAVWAVVLRWLCAGLFLVAGARVVLGVSMTDAAVVGALALAGIWVAPVLGAFVPGGGGLQLIAVAVAVAAAAAIAAHMCARTGPVRILLFALIGVLVIVVDDGWASAHAWLVDLAGFGVRGALLPGLSAPQRAIYGLVPLLFAAICLVNTVARGDDGFPRRAVAGFFGPALGGFVALGVTWGFMFAAQRAGYGLDVLHPPVVYAPVLAMLSLWLAALAAVLVARRHRRHAAAPTRIDCLAVFVLAAALGAPIGLPFLVLAGVIAALGLAVAWPMGAPRLPRWSPPLVAGLAAVSIYGAGYAVAPGVAIDAVLNNGFGLAGVFGIGASLAAIALLGADSEPARRWSDQIWILDLMAALGLVFYASGVTDMKVWAGLALSWAALALLALGATSAEPGPRLLFHALPFAWALAILALLGLLAHATSAL